MKRTLLTWLIVVSLLLPAVAQERTYLSAAQQVNHAAFQNPKVRAAADDPFDGVRALIRKQMAEQQIPSLAVAVARDGQIIWEEGFGWADRENRVAANAHTVYSLASISKPFTATGLMILKERGKIDLDRPINDYLGEAKLKAGIGNVADATVRRVANHSSGLPVHYQFFYADEPYHPPSMDETIRRYGNLVAPPGEAYEYSNLGFGILGYVIARHSGRSYTDFMRTEVFLPLGLTHTSVDLGPGLEKYQAVRYGPDGLPIPFYDFDHPAASAVFSSAHDLVRFGVFHLKAHLPDQKPILPDQAIDEMQQPTVKSGNTQGYGIGWGTAEPRTGRRIISHTGGMGGVTTVLQLLPAEKIAIVVLTNTRSSLLPQVVNAITAVLLPDAARNQPPPNQPPASPATTKPPSEFVGKWSGKVHTYKGELPLTLWFQESGDIHARLGDQLETLLNEASFRNGTLTGRMMGDIGTEDANRRPYTLRLLFKLRGETLNGAVTAFSTPGKRAGNALSYWAELKKQ